MATTDPYQLHFRLPKETGKLVDRYARFVKEAIGAELSRTDAVLALVRRGLIAWDASKGKKS
jgi:hypothetical protein